MLFVLAHTASTELSTFPLHDALPICSAGRRSGRTTGSCPRAARPAHGASCRGTCGASCRRPAPRPTRGCARSEEHTSELQSRENLVCRLLLEKKKTSRHEVPLHCAVS